MKTYLDCIPCLLRQVIKSLDATSSDDSVRETIVRDAMKYIVAMDFDQPPAAMAQCIHRRLRETTGNLDPYAKQKKRLNDAALELYPVFAEQIEKSPNPIDFAVRLAIAGNIMDLAVKDHLEISEALADFDDCLATPLDCCIDDFAREIANANNILFLTDNAGEIAFDRLLLEHLPREKVIVAVRGKPILNDATMEDAKYVGLDKVAHLVLDNGSDAPGTILEDCSDVFRRHFEEADMIIAKGQGNFETLRDSPRPIWFLFRVKCQIVANDIDCPIGTAVMRRLSH
jgi:damage-control phosphatase, subfamily I